MNKAEKRRIGREKYEREQAQIKEREKQVPPTQAGDAAQCTEDLQMGDDPSNNHKKKQN